jgi:hypothetical protein
MSRSARLSAVAAALLAAAPALAQLPASPIGALPIADGQPQAAGAAPVQWIVELGGDFGSKQITPDVQFSNGDVRSIKGNGGGFLSAGASFLPFQDGTFRTRATVGVKYYTISASNGSLSFYALPLEILETIDLRPLRLGAGLYALLGPNVSGSGFASGYDVSFDSSVGLALRAELIIPRTEIGIGARYVWNKLSSGGASVDAPAFGFVLSYGSASRAP